MTFSINPKDLSLPTQMSGAVPFVSVQDMLTLIRSTGVEALLCDIARHIEEDFRRWPEFNKVPRLANHSPDGVIELMPTADTDLYGFKYVNGHPKNRRTGHQTVVAFGVMSSVETGYPLLMTEMTLLTALRTAATSAMVAGYLAPKGATTMAMIGNGAQCEFQALAFRALCGINSLRLFDTDPIASRKAQANLAQQGFDVTLCTSAAQAVEGAPVITTCTADKTRARVLSDNLVGAGVHINAIGGDCPGKTELPAEVLNRSKVFVEYPEQTRIEGEIQQMPEDFPVTELWQVLRGEAPGRQNNSEITLFDSVGFAIEDFSALRCILGKIHAGARCSTLDLLVEPGDPRDLFGMIAEG